MVFDMSTGRINHIGIATKSLDEAETLWSALGFTGTKDEEVAEQGIVVIIYITLYSTLRQDIKIGCTSV